MEPIDFLHAQKHKTKMNLAQDITGDSTIDKLFADEFITQIKNTYSKHTTSNTTTNKSSNQQDDKEYNEGDNFNIDDISVINDE